MSDVADVVDMYLATGCRTSEVLGSRWNNIDLEADAPWATVDGTVARGGQGTPVQAHPKSKRRVALL